MKSNSSQKSASYFASRPDIVKIFDDLEQFHNFCRFELFPFNPSDLYNRASFSWRRYEKHLKSMDIKPEERRDRRPRKHSSKK